MIKTLLFFALVLLFWFPLSSWAVEPATAAVLAPAAAEGIQTAAPYITRGLVSGGRHLLQMTEHTAEILLIPWGFGQLLLMDPASGIGNIFQGCCAPVKLVGDAVLLPFAFCGITAGP